MADASKILLTEGDAPATPASGTSALYLKTDHLGYTKDATGTEHAWYQTGGMDVVVADGGTGASTLTDHGILVGSGTGAITPLAAATNGQIPIGSTGADPVIAAITAGDGIDVTNGAGTITVAADLKANGGLVIETTELAVDLGASSITGTLAVGNGGTGATTLAVNGILYGNTASAVQVTAAAASSVLVTNGSNVPSLSTDLPTAVTIGGAYNYRAGGTDVAVADGGTGLSSYVVGDILYASATGTIGKLADVAAGQVLVSGGVGVAPAYSTTPTVSSATLSTAITDNTATTQAASTAYAKSQDAVLHREPDQGVALTAAASGSIAVADNSNLDFSTGSFSGVFKGSLPDWSPSAIRVLLLKDDGASLGWQFNVQTSGILCLYSRALGTEYFSTAAVSFVDGTTHELAFVLSAGSTVTFYVDGVILGSSVAASSFNASTETSFYVLGHAAVIVAGTVHHAITYNRALTAAEVLDLYRNGVAESDKWGSQTSLSVSNCVNGSGGDAYDTFDGASATGFHAINTGSGQGMAGTASNLSVVSGKKYKISFTITTASGTLPGNYRISTGMGGAALIGTVFQTTLEGANSYEFTAGATTTTGTVFLYNNATNAEYTVTLLSVVEIGATLALTPEGIQNNRWLDATTNYLDATYPTTGWSLTRPIPNQPVLQNLLTNSQFMAMSGSTRENVGSQLITVWNNSGTIAYETFTTSGADISSAINSSGEGKGLTDAFSITAGKLLKVVATLTLNSGTAPSIYTSSDGDTANGSLASTVLSAGANTFIAEATANDVRLVVRTGNGVATNFSCTFTLYEVTPGYVAADTLAMDGWYKSYSDAATYPDIWREHTGANTKDGSFYALKMASGSTSAAGMVLWPNGIAAKENFYKQFLGRTVTFGAWVKTDVASKVRVGIYDSVKDFTSSSYHSGSGLYEWLEVTSTVSTTATSVYFGFKNSANNPAVTAYFSQPMLVYGSSIGRGNYQPIVNEQILSQANIALTGYTATTSAADAIINLEAASSGMIGKGVKAVLVKAYGKDSAAGDGVGFDVQSASGVEDGISVDTSVNNVRVQGQGWVKCDANGDIYFDHRGSGAAALTIDIKVIGIQS